jgi:hypothetical protein
MVQKTRVMIDRNREVGSGKVYFEVDIFLASIFVKVAMRRRS